MVYFIRADGIGLIKIGFTDDTDTASRLASLSAASPVTLSLIATMPGNKSNEAALHVRFKHLRSHGEWFWPTGELEEFLTSLIGRPLNRRRPPKRRQYSAKDSATVYCPPGFKAWMYRFAESQPEHQATSITGMVHAGLSAMAENRGRTGIPELPESSLRKPPRWYYHTDGSFNVYATTEWRRWAEGFSEELQIDMSKLIRIALVAWAIRSGFDLPPPSDRDAPYIALAREPE